jgi:integrase
MNFSDDLKKARAHLSDGSLKTYNSLLKSIYKNCWSDSIKEPNIKNFDKVKDVMKFLSDKSPSSRKTYLASLVCLTDNNEYKKMMSDDMQVYKDEVNKQELNEKQKASDISVVEIKQVLDDLKKHADLIYKKDKLNMNDIQQIMDYILLCLVSPIYNQPRRALDYVLMKFRGDIDESKDNQLDMKKNKLIFNVYKTSKFHHQQTLNVSPALKRILSKWIKIIPANINHLLFNSKGEPLSAITLNQRMVKIFKDRKISVNQMRHSFMSDKYSDLIKVEKEMSNDLTAMGSSIAQSKIYVKL